jgi:hypothetical protein
MFADVHLIIKPILANRQEIMEASQVKLKTDILYWAYPYFWQSVKYLHICIENASTIYI